ncbi:MAG: C4-dicarboxylate ABC transporter [Gemmatimonadetes bacterium]|nr:C4-dicarboxylate ABC transporter [Gemmatimonadota bacterium]
MSPAAISVLAIIVAAVLSVVSRINVGLVAIAFAWMIGTSMDGVGTATVLRAFPSSLFITLAGVTLLFAIAQQNGTLENLACRAVALARGNARVLPVLFFGIAMVVSTVGPGAIATVALVIPLAMAIGARANVPHFLIALMVTNGANAGNLSPISSVGVIANSSMARAGIVGHEGKVWFANLAAHALVALAAYLLLGGWRLKGDTGADQRSSAPRLSIQERTTAAVIVAWIAGVLVFNFDLGLSAFTAAALLVVLRTVDEGLAIRGMPWSAILMVSGVSLLVGVLEATGGMELFTTMLSRLATPQTVNGVIAFVTGAISIFSSTSGVVLPTFLPTSAGVVERLGGGDPLAVALSINVGASLVDVSPLSTLGALCVAAVADGVAAAKLFRQLLVWGVAMALVGALICQVFMGPLARL